MELPVQGSQDTEFGGLITLKTCSFKIHTVVLFANAGAGTHCSTANGIERNGKKEQRISSQFNPRKGR